MPRVERVGDDYIIRGVAVFDEHVDSTRPDALKQVDLAKLNRIVDNSNRRCRDTEGELPVAIGVHTPGEGESHAPPPVVGGYRNFRVGKIGADKPRNSILADIRVPASNYGFVQNYQRRSVELFPDTMELDTLVLLGSKAPARDLGPLTTPAYYDRSKGACVRYEMNNGAENEERTMDGELNKDGAPAAGWPSYAEFMQTFAAMVKGGCKEALAEALDDQPADEVPGDEAALDGEELPMDDSAPELFGDDEPTDAPPVEAPPAADEEDVQKYARHDLAVKYERQQQELKAIKAELSTARKEKTKEKYERRVSDLQAQGYAVDKADLVPFLLEKCKDDATRDAQLALVEKYARKSKPEFGGRIDYARREDPTKYASEAKNSNGQLNKEQADQVFKLAREIGYDAAKAKVLNGVV